MVHYLNYSFYETVLTLCAERKTTISTLVKELGMSTGSIRHWKNGSVPTGDKVSAIAKTLGVTTDYLLGRKDTSLSEPRNRLIKLAQTLPEDKINALLVVADTLK